MRFSHLFGFVLALGLCAASPRDASRDHTAVGHQKKGHCEKLRSVPYLSDVAHTPFGRHYQAARVGNGTTYRYVHIRPRRRNHPYILFIHGFPSSAYDWRNQIIYFSRKGYGIIAPDLLGYGGTDQPLEPEAYRFKKMSEEIIGILDCERIKTVFGVGHDWGSPMVSRLANYFPSRFRSYAFLDVGYADPGTPPDRPAIERLNNQTTASLGYPIYGYWSFFTSPEGGPIIDSRRDSFFSLCYPADYQTIWVNYFARAETTRQWLIEDRRAPIGEWVTEEDRRIHTQIFNRHGYTPALNWYTARYFGLDNAEDEAIPKSRAILNRPVLLITAGKDPIVRPAASEASTRPFAPDLRIEQVQAGHWVQLEKKDEVNAILEKFFEEVKGKKG